MKPATINRCYEILAENGYTRQEVQTIADAAQTISQDTLTLARVLWEANASVRTIAGFMSRSESTVRAMRNGSWDYETYKRLKKGR